MHRNCLKYIKNYFNLDLNELHKKERVGGGENRTLVLSQLNLYDYMLIG